MKKMTDLVLLTSAFTPPTFDLDPTITASNLKDLVISEMYNRDCMY